MIVIKEILEKKEVKKAERKFIRSPLQIFLKDGNDGVNECRDKRAKNN